MRFVYVNSEAKKVHEYFELLFFSCVDSRYIDNGSPAIYVYEYDYKLWGTISDGKYRQFPAVQACFLSININLNI